jgi:hypothetical protein
LDSLGRQAPGGAGHEEGPRDRRELHGYGYSSQH